MNEPATVFCPRCGAEVERTTRRADGVSDHDCPVIAARARYTFGGDRQPDSHSYRPGCCSPTRKDAS